MIPITHSKAVQAAKADGRPIVALESTIITHGMPAPRNIDVARSVEDVIYGEGAVPATIAVLDGVLHIGLEPEELDALGVASNVAKLSRADLAACIATGGTGATTVAATMIAARIADIPVFATGGIGGVHKGAETTFDISADLQELAQSAVTVVAAGAKAILDLPKTLEVLETLGVPVIAYGQDDFPAFWSQSSNLRAPMRMDDPHQIARAHALRGAMGIPGGQLVANPIPAEDAIAPQTLAPIIAAAQKDADSQGVAGKAVTPFLLQQIFERTHGQSLEANITLVQNNARLAARIACSLCEL